MSISKWLSQSKGLYFTVIDSTLPGRRRIVTRSLQRPLINHGLASRILLFFHRARRADAEGTPLVGEPRLEGSRVGGLDERLNHFVADGPLPLEVRVPGRLPLRREPHVLRLLRGIDRGPLVLVGRRLVSLRLPHAERYSRRRSRRRRDRVALGVPALVVSLGFERIERVESI